MKIHEIVYWPFKLMWLALTFLFQTKALKSEKGAGFAKYREYNKYLNNSNKGLLLDGEDARLSESNSFQNVCVMARVGAGKTSRYIIPNVLNRANTKCSIVVNDPKGEVFETTSQFMKERGFNIIVIDPQNLSRSSCFNPLAEAKDDLELEQIAEILVKCGNPEEKGFWNQGATRFVSLFLRCLKNAKLDNENYYTLSNLYYLFQNFGEDGSNLDAWVAKYSMNPDDPSDSSLWNDWKGVLTGNAEGVASFVLNAITSLKALSNRNIALLTSKSDFDLSDLKKSKTIIYFITPPQHAEYYSFLTSVFFRSVFNACMRELPNKKTLPVYILYDEFGHSTLPNFVSTANTIRGYRVSLSIILQSISQLSAKYGKDTSYSIQGGFNTYLAYSGSDPETAKFFEQIIGRTRVTQIQIHHESKGFSENYREQNLINSNEVRTISEDEVLIVSSNKKPVLMKTTPYFKNSKLKRFVKRGEVNIKTSMPTALTYLDLDI